MNRVVATGLYGLLVPLMLSVSAVQADNWPNWRGPSQTGVAAGNNYPVRWSGTLI